MKHVLILFWVSVLLFAITIPAVATPTEPADGSFSAELDFRSEDASWITGQVIYADGGASLMNAEVAPEIQLA